VRVLRLAVWAMTWAALGYLWRRGIAYRERLPAALLGAVSPPPFALPPPPEVIDLPALALPRLEAPKDIDANEEMVTPPPPSAAPAPPAEQVRAVSVQRMAFHSGTAGRAVAVIVTGVVVGAVLVGVFVVWMLSALPSPP
jgi:hypothetical protein